jgi:hypothetical protein
MNILTDILSLFKRKKFATKAGPNDVIILGINEEPEMTGIASPIPYKSVKLIKIKDFKIAAEHCDHVNTPEVPASEGQVYQKTTVDPETEKCTIYFRSLKSLSSNLNIALSADDNYVELSTTGESNTAANVGTGSGVWKDKIGETLNFRSLTDNGTTITQLANEIAIGPATTVQLTSPDGGVWQLYVDNSGNLTTQSIS